MVDPKVVWDSDLTPSTPNWCSLVKYTRYLTWWILLDLVYHVSCLSAITLFVRCAEYPMVISNKCYTYLRNAKIVENVWNPRVLPWHAYWPQSFRRSKEENQVKHLASETMVAFSQGYGQEFGQGWRKKENSAAEFVLHRICCNYNEEKDAWVASWWRMEWTKWEVIKFHPKVLASCG